jgi:hypothetical protein
VKYLDAFLATNPEFEVAVETRALIAALRGDKESPEDKQDD